MSNEFQLFPEFAELFGKEAEQYALSLARRFGEVKVLGMPRPVQLLSLYVRVNILAKITSRVGANLEEMEKVLDFDRRSFGKRQETKDGEEIVNQLEKFIVLGKPGAGKTTFLKFLTLSILHAETKIQKRRLPIFITLHDWANRRTSLMDYITYQFDINSFEQTESYIERALKSGKCLVLFDGLDEVSQEANIDGIIRDIRDFTDKYSNNQFIISCRNAAYNHSFERFSDVEIADFNEKQIETFVKNWFSEDPDRAAKCLDALNANPQFQELASVPLLLTLLCLTYENTGAFPQQRASLYQEAIKILLEQWDEKRPGGQVKRDEIYKNLSRENKEALLARIAYGTFLENQYFIREDHLAKMIQNFLKNLPQYQNEKIVPDGAHISNQIEAQHGILVERAKGIYSFAHLTFQEYFTAKQIADYAPHGTLEYLVEIYLNNDKWKEVFCLVASMLPDSGELILVMLKKNRELLEKDWLNKLLVDIDRSLLLGSHKWAIEVRKLMMIFRIFAGSRPANISSVARSIALLLVRDNDFKYIYNFTKNVLNAHDNLDSTRLDGLDLHGVSTFESILLEIELSKPFFEALDVLENLNQKLDTDFGITIPKYDGSRYSFDSTMEILHFFKGNHLIVQCLSSAAYLSKSTREYVLSMLLAPLTEEERAAMGMEENE